MRLEINIPDTLYSEAQSAAAADGLSLDRYLADLLKLHLRSKAKNGTTLRLSAEQIDFIRQGQADAKAGNCLTMELLEERSALNKAAWHKENRA